MFIAVIPRYGSDIARTRHGHGWDAYIAHNVVHFEVSVS